MNDEMDQKLDELLSRLPKNDYDLDAWLVEDETATFERIVRQRRRKRAAWWLSAAAAVVAGGVFVFAPKAPLAVSEVPLTAPEAPLTTSEDEVVAVAAPLPCRGGAGGGVTISQSASKILLTPPPTPPLQGRGAAARLQDLPKPATALAAKSATTLAAMPAIALAATESPSPVDSLADLVARIEQGLEDVRDSCYIANMEKLIATDSRLQRLVNRLILDGIIRDTTYATANNTDNLKTF